jgi:hypothetical protein
MDDMGYLYVVEVYVNNFMSLFIPMRRVQLRHVDNAIMNGIHDVFPPNDIDSKDPIKDVNGDLASGAFSYSSVVGMLLYLSGHTLPNITFAVNCCSRYMFCPKHSHELALKQIVCYLKQTPDWGMVMNPSSNVCKIDAYPDADFAGMYGHEEHTDPACAKSRTGFIIAFADCPVFW